jgi:hypothetical protein
MFSLFSLPAITRDFLTQACAELPCQQRLDHGDGQGEADACAEPEKPLVGDFQGMHVRVHLTPGSSVEIELSSGVLIRLEGISG